MYTLDEVSTILTDHGFRDTTDADTKKRTKRKRFFNRGIYSINLDDTGGGIIVDLYKNSVRIDDIHRPSKECFTGLFAVMELSSFHKESIDKKFLHLNQYYEQLISKNQERLTAGQKVFIAHYNFINTEIY